MAADESTLEGEPKKGLGKSMNNQVKENCQMDSLSSSVQFSPADTGQINSEPTLSEIRIASNSKNDKKSENKPLGLMSLNDNKAGMKGLDKEKINSIIENASKGSKFYAKQKENQARIDGQIESLKFRHESLTNKEILLAKQEADSFLDHLNQDLDLSRTIVHVDMDMFYAAVEMRDNPHLRDKPMAVGGMGMLSTSNYAARKFGVRAAMPGFIGKKLCPELVIVPVNMNKYAEESKIIRQVFSEYDENYAPMSLDEAYIDLTDYLLINPDANAWDSVQEMREKIVIRTKLTASAGIAPNTFLAKVCSDLNKPNGQYILEADQSKILQFIQDLPIRKAPGIGNVQEQLLRSIGVQTCGDMYKLRAQIKLLFSQLSFEHYIQVSQGIGSTMLEAPEDRIRKSISTETTFKETSDRKKLFELCDDLSDELAETMKEKDIYGQAVSIKIKSHDFKLKTKIRQISSATNCSDVIKCTAKQLLTQLLDSSEGEPLALRLLGVRMSELKSKEDVGSSKQKSIFSFLQSKNNPIDNKVKNKDGSSTSHQDSDFSCPICGEMIVGLNNLNLHVDKCLSQSPITNSNSFKSQNFETSNSSKDDNINEKEDENNEKNVNDNLLNSKESCKTESDKCENASKSYGKIDQSKSYKSSDQSKSDKSSDQSKSDKSSDQSISDEMLDQSKSDKSISQSKSDESRYQLTCPVCFNSKFDSEINLNQHIDICLNKEFLEDALKTSSMLQPSNGGHFHSEDIEPSRKRKCDQAIAEKSTHHPARPRKKNKTSLNKIDSYFRKS